MVGYIKNILGSLISLRRTILELAINDFKSKYLGSALGVVWAFVQPTIMILILWFVFQIGFRSMPVEDVPFVLWLVAGLVPWFFISEAISNGTNAILDNSYLVKKIVFQVEVLPLIKILSSLFIHLFFVVFTFIMFFIYGYEFSIYNLQVIYYVFATVVLVLGVTLITSSLNVFLKDIGQFVSLILQFFFWATPIFWSMSLVPENLAFIFKLNPFYYIIEGFRKTFIYHQWFWEFPNLTLYFWMISILSIIIGVFLFKKLKPHFSDVL